MKKIMTSDVIEWVEGVGNEIVLNEIATVIKARLIHLKYIEDGFPL